MKSFKLFSLVIMFSLSGCSERFASPTAPRVSQIPSSELKLQRLLTDGKNLLSLSRYDDALLKYEHALYLYPNLEQALLGKARALAGFNEYETALKIVDEAIAASKTPFPLRSERAKMLISSGLPEEGITELLNLIKESEVLELISEIPLYRRNLSDAYFQLGYENEALCQSKLSYNDLFDSKDDLLRHVNVALSTLQYRDAAWSISEFTLRKGVQSDTSFFALRAMTNRAMGNIEDAMLDARTALQFEQSIGTSQEAARFLIAIMSKELFPNTFQKDEPYTSLIERVKRSNFFWLAMPPKVLDEI